ncbi:MAG TPA: glycoside hydrolase 43 family protein [Cyclobacteriaceae bacterium]|jgi:beta-xylosidase|nr:glycoside hydrolase 43 family protein [Cyclobacteriaceae bacterium]
MRNTIKSITNKMWSRSNFLFILVLTGNNLMAQKPSNFGDQHDGTYRNPIVYADYSDPDVIRVDEDYYMTASSFHCMPGLPILHSKDMINWKIINHALTLQIPSDFFNIPRHGFGVWAPTIRFHNGEYYIYWGDPDYGVYVVKTNNPANKWSDPILVLPGKGIIDPCPLWDNDGNVYLVHGWAASRSGINSLLTLNKMNAEGTKVVNIGRHIYDGHGNNPTIEGPKLYKRNGYYYIFAPAGGVATGWQLVLRSKNIYGPYEEKIVLEQGTTKTNGPHQGAWVETPKGESWFYHFQDVGTYGRIVHIQPMQWKNDWPLMGLDKDNNGIGEPVEQYKKPDVGKNTSETEIGNDEFTNGSLGLQWQWQANPSITWSASIAGKDYLRLFAIQNPVDAVNLWPAPNLLLQKFPAPDFTATTKIKFTVEWDAPGKKAGLLIMGNDYSYLSIEKQGQQFIARQIICKQAYNDSTEHILATVVLPGNEVYMRVQVKSPEASCKFSYSTDGEKYTEIGVPFTAQPDRWTGAKVGLFCISERNVRSGSYMDVDWFRITELDNKK